MICSLHSSTAQQEHGGRNDYERAIEDQNQRCELCDARPRREDFFRKDQGSEERHRRDVHNAQGKKKYEEQPVTSQAVLRTWLYRIATNACLDALKKRLPRTLPVAVSPEADPLHFPPELSR